MVFYFLFDRKAFEIHQFKKGKEKDETETHINFE